MSELSTRTHSLSLSPHSITPNTYTYRCSFIHKIPDHWSPKQQELHNKKILIVEDLFGVDDDFTNEFGPARRKPTGSLLGPPRAQSRTNLTKSISSGMCVCFVCTRV